MPFWTYMLHCRGGYFYVGHTDELERRIGEHKSGLIPGFTADHQPVELVWAEEFQTRDDAKATERKLKGWSRAKKLALIRGDWDRISTLARGKSGPSTSSGQSVGGVNSFPISDCPEMVEEPFYSLWPHPAAGALFVESVRCAMTRFRPDLLEIIFTVEAPAGTLVFPSGTGARRDGLWKSTCFELFIGKAGSGAYREFNFSPGGDWAAYAFSSYRSEQHDLSMHAPPSINIDKGPAGLTARVRISIDDLLDDDPVGICAVIDEAEFGLSYWSIWHAGPKPDFHHPACFAASLPAPRNP